MIGANVGIVFYQDVNLQFEKYVFRRFFNFREQSPEINPFLWYSGDVELMLGLKKDTLLNEVFTKFLGSGGSFSIISSYIKFEQNAFWSDKEIFDETKFFVEKFGAREGSGMIHVGLDWNEVLINSKLLKIMIDSGKYEISDELKSWIELNLLKPVNCRMIEMDRNPKVPGFWKTLWNKLFKPKTVNQKPKTAEAVTDESLLDYAKSMTELDSALGIMNDELESRQSTVGSQQSTKSRRRK